MNKTNFFNIKEAEVLFLCACQVQRIKLNVATLLIVASNFLDGRPGLTELQQFITKDGKSLNLMQDIGAKYDGFGTCLLDDTHGSIIAAIRSDHHSVESKMREIFTKWLQGMII
jgi:hypothetical protein